MGLIDSPTLLVLLLSGIGLGAAGLCGFDPIGSIMSERSERILFICVGVSATWQFCRQPWWGGANDGDDVDAAQRD